MLSRVDVKWHVTKNVDNCEMVMHAQLEHAATTMGLLYTGGQQHVRIDSDCEKSVTVRNNRDNNNNII